METAGQETRKIETQLRQMGAKLDRMHVQASTAGTADNDLLRSRIDVARDKHAVVRTKLQAFKASSGQQWDNFRGDIATAWREFADAFNAVSAGRL